MISLELKETDNDNNNWLPLYTDIYGILNRKRRRASANSVSKKIAKLYLLEMKKVI